MNKNLINVQLQSWIIMHEFTAVPLQVKVGFHYPSSRAELTGRVDGPRTRVHFLTPVNSGRELG